MSDRDDHVLREQIAYYEARAGEYDEWFMRQGRYDRGEERTAEWMAEVDQVRDALARLPIDGARVLELAPGTGLWTELIARRAKSVVAVDASPEMIAQCRRRLGGLADRVTFELADLFSWGTDEEFDAVVFCFWISHVPRDHVDAFLATVARALRSGGVLFFVDSKREETSTAQDHVLPDAGHEIMVRRLDDGREFSVVKNFWSGDELAKKFGDAGLQIAITETPTYFQYGVGGREP